VEVRPRAGRAAESRHRLYLNGGNWSVIAEFTEAETGKRNDRPQLERALATGRKNKARVVIAKLDPLFRNLVFVAALTDSDIEFVAVDNLHYLHANRLTLHILAAVAPAHEGSNPSVSASHADQCFDLIAKYISSTAPSPPVSSRS